MALVAISVVGDVGVRPYRVIEPNATLFSELPILEQVLQLGSRLVVDNQTQQHGEAYFPTQDVMEVCQFTLDAATAPGEKEWRIIYWGYGERIYLVITEVEPCVKD